MIFNLVLSPNHINNLLSTMVVKIFHLQLILKWSISKNMLLTLFIKVSFEYYYIGWHNVFSYVEQVDYEDNNNLNKINSTAVRISYLYDGCVRLVLHKDISEEDVDMVIAKLKYVIRKISSFDWICILPSIQIYIIQTYH